MRLKHYPTRRRIADQIFRERARLGWTQMELARRLRVRRNTVASWENGVHGPSIEAMADLAAALGTTFTIGESHVR